VQLIAALATRADLLVLDEPTSGLDPLMEVVFREAVLEAKGRGQAEFLSEQVPGPNRSRAVIRRSPRSAHGTPDRRRPAPDRDHPG
jgi:ABC-type nitrate/sulfonate/bicarbonate transport system ATPase subunit